MGAWFEGVVGDFQVIHQAGNLQTGAILIAKALKKGPCPAKTLCLPHFDVQTLQLTYIGG